VADRVRRDGGVYVGAQQSTHSMATHDAADLSCTSPAGPTGDDYQGEYKRDKRNGVGVYMFASGASGATYEGDFKDGKPHGIGVYTFRSGKKTLGSRGVCGLVRTHVSRAARPCLVQRLRRMHASPVEKLS
jgi:hypothetical protein